MIERLDALEAEAARAMDAARDHGALEDADVVSCGKVLRYGLSPEVLQCSTKDSERQ